MIPNDLAYYKLALFSVSAAENAVKNMIEAAKIAKRSRAATARDCFLCVEGATNAAIHAAKETLRFCKKYAPHAEAGKNALGSIDALDGILDAAERLKHIEDAYEAAYDMAGR